MNLKRMMLSVTALIATAFVSVAQKDNVFIDYFYRPSDVSFAYAESLRSSVMEGIINSNRVNLIDVDASDALRIEEERRKSGELSAGEDMDRLKLMVQEGANYLITGRVTTIAAYKETSESGSVWYNATCAYTLKIINPANGTTIAAQNFKHSTGGLSFDSSSNPDEAVAKVCAKAKGEMDKFIEKNFKVQGTILELSKLKNDKVEELYIDLGTANGVTEKDRFDVCIERMIGNRKSQKVIGEIEITNVEGDDISLSKVKKGHKEIKAAFDAGQTLVIKSKPKGGGFGDILNKTKDIVN